MIDNIRHFIEACGPFGYPLLICSVLQSAAIIYHAFFTGDSRALRRLETALAADRQDLLQVLRNEVRHRNSAPAAVVRFLLQHRGEPQLERQTESRLRLLADSYRAGLSTVSMITNISPMLGILGTAWGLMQIFGVFGSAQAQPGIAAGISTALYTTVFGLAVAVPGVIALTYFERRLEHRAARLEYIFTELLVRSANAA